MQNSQSCRPFGYQRIVFCDRVSCATILALILSVPHTGSGNQKVVEQREQRAKGAAVELLMVACKRYTVVNGIAELWAGNSIAFASSKVSHLARVVTRKLGHVARFLYI